MKNKRSHYLEIASKVFILIMPLIFLMIFKINSLSAEIYPYAEMHRYFMYLWAYFIYFVCITIFVLLCKNMKPIFYGVGLLEFVVLFIVIKSSMLLSNIFILEFNSNLVMAGTFILLYFIGFMKSLNASKKDLGK